MVYRFLLFVELPDPYTSSASVIEASALCMARREHILNWQKQAGLESAGGRGS
jgi:hypothetical protein